MSLIYENIIKNNESLDLLFNKNELFYVTNFNNVDFENKDFIDWLSPKYYKIFLSFLENEKSNVKISLLMRNTLLCNAETKSNIINKLLEFLDQSLLNILYIKKTISEDVEKSLLSIEKTTSTLNVVIFNNFKDERIVSYRDKITHACLDINDYIFDNKLRKNFFAIPLTEKITVFLKQIKFKGEMDKFVRTNSESFKENTEANEALRVLGIGGAILLILWRLFRVLGN